jgi:hypothetical protein
MTFRSLYQTATLTLVILLCSISSASGSPFESTKTFRASAILPKEQLRSSYHHIDEEVINSGYLNRYSVRSQYGDQIVAGRHLLAIRLAELRALDEISKLSRSSVFIDAAKKNGKAALLAPVHLAERVVSVVQEPGQVVDTAKRIPDGVSRMFSWAHDQVGSGLEFVGRQIASPTPTANSTKGSSNNGAVSDNDDLTKATNLARDTGLRYIKYSSTEREWFKRLAVDQYTDNIKIHDEVARVSQVETAVNLGFKFVPGFNLGLVGTVMKWYGRAEELGLYEPYDALASKNRDRLKALGVEPETAKAFEKNKILRPSFQTVILDCLGKMETVKHRDRFIELAARTESPEQGIYYMDACQMLLNYNGKDGSIQEIVSSLKIPGAVTTKSRVVLPLAVEHLLWTQHTQSILDEYKKVLNKQARVTAGTAIILGHASLKARKGLQKEQLDVVELNQY